MKREQLDSEVHQLRSLAAEWDLLQGLVRRGQVNRTFADGHAQYLRNVVREHAELLTKAQPAPGLAADLARARERAAELERRLQ